MEIAQLNFEYIHLKEVDSTNRYAIELLSKTAPIDGFCVFSDFQTEGKGQYGRSWQSEADSNLLMSFIFNMKSVLQDTDLFALNLISSLALDQVLQAYFEPSIVKIKWPNDILVNHKKIAGILIQNIFRGQEHLWTVIGIGLNVNQMLFDHQLNATSIAKELSYKVDKIYILQRIHDELLRLFNNLKSNQFNNLLEDYNSRLYLHHQVCTLEKANEDIIEGKIRSVDRYGMLNVELGNKIQAFDFSSIRILPKNT